jgi:16S rRNA (uracil1498-N3)-methyltransferase
MRLFVPPDCVGQDRLHLTGDMARRVHAARLRPGDVMTVLDDSSWEINVRLTRVSAREVWADLVDRQLAPEPRTKVSIYYAALHPGERRKLAEQATQAGAVALTPIVANRSAVGDLAGGAATSNALRSVMVAAAEASGRGRLPRLFDAMMFDRALECAAGRGRALLLYATAEHGLESALEGRPFSVELFVGPTGGFTNHEVALARRRGVHVVRPPVRTADTVRLAVSTLRDILRLTA